jgi:hypothetical protein
MPNFRLCLVDRSFAMANHGVAFDFALAEMIKRLFLVVAVLLSACVAAERMSC